MCVKPERLLVAHHGGFDDSLQSRDWFGGLLLPRVDRRSEVPEREQDPFNDAVIYCPPVSGKYTAWSDARMFSHWPCTIKQKGNRRTTQTA